MTPLAERLRPRKLADYVGQEHIVGADAALPRMIAGGHVSSFILWGPPGVGKTTLAQIVARELDAPFFTLSAVSSGVKEVRDVIGRAAAGNYFGRQSPILFIDEIHRFSKSQQDSLLAAVETGTITLIGATTENPSFEVIRPLLSRCAVYVLKPLDSEALLTLARRAIATDEVLSRRTVVLQEPEALVHYSGGDARRMLGILDLLVTATPAERPVLITSATIAQHLQQSPVAYDKDGDMHYDLVSALIKSIRGSDPDAALYYLARMIEGGEDPKFIGRRLIISAAEDIGLANPNALLMANAAFTAVERIGWPEGRIPLAEAIVYLATSPKSNSAYKAIGEAQRHVRSTGNLPVPLHLRNAPTQLMENLGYGAEYLYPHDYPGHFVAVRYLPEAIDGTRYYYPADNPAELKIAERQRARWGGHSSHDLKD